MLSVNKINSHQCEDANAAWKYQGDYHNRLYSHASFLQHSEPNAKIPINNDENDKVDLAETAGIKVVSII